MLLQTRGVGKAFSGVSVLKDIDFELEAGEIHALAGENGAGKSTFIKILSGVYGNDSGSISLAGKTVKFRNIKQSESTGVRTVHQEINLVPFFRVYQNIFAGDELRRSFLGIPCTDDALMIKKTKDIFSRLCIDIDPLGYTHGLDASRQRIVQIAKILVQNPRVMIFDEPTTSLGERERAQLLEIIKSLKSRDMGIIYISHNLDEIMEIADRITVFRDGAKVDSREIGTCTKSSIVSMMIGKKEYVLYSRKEKPDPDTTLLRLEGLCNHKLKNVDISLHKGEILGIAGVMGSGKSEIAKAIYGIDKISHGHTYLKGKRFNPDIHFALSNRIAFVPEERQAEGLVANFSVEKNISLAYLDTFKRGLQIDSKRETATAREYIDTMGIKTTGPGQAIKFLSGGNQQKVILSRWLYGDFEIGLFDEPTKGIDVKAKEDIYRLVGEMADRGKAVIFFSSYLPELLTVCDRILVMVNGRVKGEYRTDEADAEQRIFEAMLSGGTDNACPD
jgi:ribose transport system ATP-binding protein